METFQKLWLTKFIGSTDNYIKKPYDIYLLFLENLLTALYNLKFQGENEISQSLMVKK